MATTKIKFSPSVNIIRDSNYSFNYISTNNAQVAFNSIMSDSDSGIKSHLIIGAYGTGKSSFLLALKQTLEESHTHFEQISHYQTKYTFINIVGEYNSLESYFASYFKLGKKFSSQDIISALDNAYTINKKKGLGLAIIIDEFGKYLEFAANNNPESELYFIQQLSEWVNDASKKTLFISTLHQDFNSYSYGLNKLQRQEWDKVKGRIKEIPFNEPVEQLLFLASERISQKFSNYKADKNFDTLFNCIKEANAFPLRDYFELNFAKKLVPFDILSAGILTLGLQKYGQNERSLFSFIESNDHLGINDFVLHSSGYFNIGHVYDYLINGYYTYLTTKYNPHYSQWSAIRRGLERTDGLFNDQESQQNAEDLIKLIGLLNIFATAAAKLDRSFYIGYGKLAMGISNSQELLEILEKKKLIRFVGHSCKYILFEGTDLDIDIAIDDAGRLVEKVSNVVNHLNQYFEFPFIPAKASYYRFGTPRFFQFKLTESPINQIPEGQFDGFINLVFSEEPAAEKAVVKSSLETQEAILFGYYKNTGEIKNILFEIQKIKKVKDSNTDDRVALKELDSILEHYIKLLNHYVLDNLYANEGNIVWYFKGEKVKINSRHIFNQQLSNICEEVYSGTPIYKNELVNKSKVSGQVAFARRRLIDKLFGDFDKPDLGFSNNEFPPEKSIYLTLLKKTGIHKVENELGTLRAPTDLSFNSVWEACTKFLDSSKGKERKLTELINILSARPFKLKQGFIDYWIPIFLLTKRDEFALYENNTYLPELNADILELVNKRPGLYTIKAFDVVGIKLELFNRYRVFLNQAENTKPTNKIFIQTIRPFLAFYRDLSEYSKKTNRLPKKTLSLRKVIESAKDPEKAFFEDFPTALGFTLNDLQNDPKVAEIFVTQLQKSIRELRSSYELLIDRFEKYFIKDIISTKKAFPEYKDQIVKRFIGLKTHLLLPQQKTFFNRLQSGLEDRTSWLNSIAQACIGKPLSSISDNEEVVLFDKLKDYIYELDNLTEISSEQVDMNEEDVVKLEITSFVRGINKNTFRFPKAKENELSEQIKKLKGNLGKDKNMNIVALTKLLQQLIGNE